MLLLFMEEQQAYWVLSVICEEFFAESYTLDMAGASIDSVVLEESCASTGASHPDGTDAFLPRGCPELAETLTEMGVSVSLLSAQWFLCLYVDVFPTAATARTWDMLMLDGSGVVFAVALAAFQAASDRLLATTKDPEADLHNVVQTLQACTAALTDTKPSGGRGRSPIDWVFERADFGAFHEAALARRRAAVRYRLEQKPGGSSEDRLENRMERGARAMRSQLAELRRDGLRSKLGELETRVDSTLDSLDATLDTLETSVDSKIKSIFAVDNMEKKADKMEAALDKGADEVLAAASKLGKKVGGRAQGMMGSFRKKVAEGMASIEQEWQTAAADVERERAWPRHYTVVERAVVRSGWQLESEKLGELEVGAALAAFDSVTAPETRGVERVKFGFEGKDGWTSVTSTGGVAILQLAQPPPKSAG